MSLFPREVELALAGQLQEAIEAADEAVLTAAKRAITRVTDATKARLRGMVRDAGLGPKLANTVRGEVYPRGRQLAREPAGWVFVQESAVRIFEAFETGATIRAAGGGYLAIPIPGSPADRRSFGRQRSGETIIETIRARGVKLSFVPGNGSRPAMLVAESARVRTGANGRERVSTAARTAAGRFAQGAASIPLFWLVPEAKMPKRLNWNREFERATASFMAEFSKAFAEEFAALGRAGGSSGRRGRAR